MLVYTDMEGENNKYNKSLSPKTVEILEGILKDGNIKLAKEIANNMFPTENDNENPNNKRGRELIEKQILKKIDRDELAELNRYLDEANKNQNEKIAYDTQLTIEAMQEAQKKFPDEGDDRIRYLFRGFLLGELTNEEYSEFKKDMKGRGEDFEDDTDQHPAEE